MTKGLTSGRRACIAVREAELITNPVNGKSSMQIFERLTCSIEIVSIILGIPFTRMNEIRLDSAHTKDTCGIPNGVGRVSEVAIGQPNLLPFISLRSFNRSLRRRLKVRGESGQWDRAAWPNRWCCRWEVGGDRVCRWVQTRIRAEIGGFVHVNPQGVNIDSGLGIKELLKLRSPVILSTLIEPVWENSDTRPNSTCIV